MVSLIPWAFVAFTSLFAFDKPGSEKDPSIWMMVAPILAYPLIAASCIIGSVVLYKNNRSLPALIVIAVPLAAIILYAAIAGIYTIVLVR
jgi:heme A synthase